MNSNQNGEPQWSNTTIGQNVYIGENVSICNAIIGNGAYIENGAIIHGSPKQKAIVPAGAIILQNQHVTPSNQGAI